MEDNEYILKHRDTDVAEFAIDKESMLVSGIKILDEKFSPINYRGNEIVTAGNLNYWLSSRCVPNSREGIERLKTVYKVKEVKEIMFLQMGLSLSDHYWIDNNKTKNKWKDINLFENRYDEIFGKIIFDKKLRIVNDINAANKKSPDGTTGGNLRKYWEYNKNNNKSYLVKSGSGERKQEPFNEYFASLLLDELKFDYTPYVVRKERKEWVSVCPCISDINNELISASDIIRKYGIRENYNDFLNLAQGKSVIGFKESLDKMIILDYMINNTDRHWNNFGILLNGETGTWIGLAPIYDNGYSLWNNDFIRHDLPVKNRSFADYNEDCIELVNINNYVKELPDMIVIFDKAFKNYENDDRKRDLRKGIEVKQTEIREYIKNVNVMQSS